MPEIIEREVFLRDDHTIECKARGGVGRLPIIGSFDTSLHSNAWIFTGLSSQGLLYHGLFGDFVSDLMLSGGNAAEDESPEIIWWRKRFAKRK
jgi:glycine/D-amino acid oxidase-like deaminating enzyme